MNIKFQQIQLAVEESENRAGVPVVQKYLFALDSEGQVWRFIFKTGEDAGYWVRLPSPSGREK